MVVFFVPLLLLWPLPLLGSGVVLSRSDQEASTHIWGLWLALHERSPWSIHTDRVNYPEGFTWSLIDPANLPSFTLGFGLGGPALGYNLTLYFGFVLLGLAGWALGREVGGSPWLAALTAAACPAMMSMPARGMTEELGVAWVGLGLAAALAFRRTGAPRSGLMVMLCAMMSAYSGPYNGLWCALLLGSVTVWTVFVLHRGRGLRLIGAGLGAVLFSLPLLWSWAGRGAAQPGAAQGWGLPSLPSWSPVTAYRGGLLYGADLLDVFVPVVVTGGEAVASHTAYLGVVTAFVAMVVVWRRRSMWPWAAGALVMALLSLGPYLFFAGRPVVASGGIRTGPAAALTILLSTTFLVTRWYRAGAVAHLLLAPLVGMTSEKWRVVVGGLVLVDALFLAPLVWPLPTARLPETEGWSKLPPGAVLEMPLSRTAAGDGWQEPSLLMQSVHGQPSAIAPFATVGTRENRQFVEAIEGFVQGRRPLQAHLRRLIRERGFHSLAVHPDLMVLPPKGAARLDACLGVPLWRSPSLWLYDLRQDHGADCDVQ